MLMKDLEYYVDKYEHVDFIEFQKTEDYNEMVIDMEKECDLNKMTIVIALYAWYHEKVNGIELPNVEKENVSYSGEVKGVEVYDPIDYNFKYAELLEKEKENIKMEEPIENSLSTI